MKLKFIQQPGIGLTIEVFFLRSVANRQTVERARFENRSRCRLLLRLHCHGAGHGAALRVEQFRPRDGDSISILQRTL